MSQLCETLALGFNHYCVVSGRSRKLVYGTFIEGGFIFTLNKPLSDQPALAVRINVKLQYIDADLIIDNLPLTTTESALSGPCLADGARL